MAKLKSNIRVRISSFAALLGNVSMQVFDDAGLANDLSLVTNLTSVIGAANSRVKGRVLQSATLQTVVEQA